MLQSYVILINPVPLSDRQAYMHIIIESMSVDMKQVKQKRYRRK